MSKTRRFILNSVLAASAAVVVAPTLALANPTKCYESTIAWCNGALEGASWYEKIIIGDACTAMMVGCALQS